VKDFNLDELDIWISVDEVRPKLQFDGGQEEEWLSFGPIARHRVLGVFPSDGKSIQWTPNIEVQHQTWKFDWARQSWIDVAADYSWRNFPSGSQHVKVMGDLVAPPELADRGCVEQPTEAMAPILSEPEDT
jgi:hypothetical protein